MNRSSFPFAAVTVLAASQLLVAQTTTTPTAKAPATPTKSSAKKSKVPAAKEPVSGWTPDVQQVLGVSQGSFTMVGLNKLSKAQLDSLINVTRNATAGDPKKHLLTCAPATASTTGATRVLVTVSGDDAQGLRLAEIRQAIRSLPNVEIVDAPANADRALHVVVQEQTLGKRIIGYTASYMTATPCRDDFRKADIELKGQLGTYTDPKGSDLARDLAAMLDKDLQTFRSGT